jgi:uncharacterized membrane protein
MQLIQTNTNIVKLFKITNDGLHGSINTYGKVVVLNGSILGSGSVNLISGGTIQQVDMLTEIFGGTGISIGGNVGFLDASLKQPYQWRPTSWLWNFGGTGASAGATGLTAQNPLVSFSVAGNYTVTLTASNTSGSVSKTKTNFVTVS